MPADAVLTWRRSVYERGLWAVPLASDTAAGAARSGGAAAGVGRERRLEDWVGRELRALFQSDVSAFPPTRLQVVVTRSVACTDGAGYAALVKVSCRSSGCTAAQPIALQECACTFLASARRVV